jgi:hypothetical protein
MENANLTSRKNEGSKNDSGGDEDPVERATRNFISLATGVAGTVAAFYVGFGILPNVSRSEQLLNISVATALSGAIIAGIGAWRSIRRFIVMSIFGAVAVICLAALVVVVQAESASQTTADSSRTSNQPNPISQSPSVGATPAQVSPTASTATTGSAASAAAPQSQQSLPNHPECFDTTIFNSIPAQRIAIVHNNGNNGVPWQRVGSESANPDDLAGQYGIFLIDDNTGAQGAIRVDIDPVNQQFSIKSDIDGGCGDLQMAPISGSLGSRISFTLGNGYTGISFQIEAGGGRYWFEVSSF